MNELERKHIDLFLSGEYELEFHQLPCYRVGILDTLDNPSHLFDDMNM